MATLKNFTKLYHKYSPIAILIQSVKFPIAINHDKFLLTTLRRIKSKENLANSRRLIASLPVIIPNDPTRYIWTTFVSEIRYIETFLLLRSQALSAHNEGK